jgi:uncharacterized membrane protein
MTGSNANARLEAFCDGVFAIALTLLIIDVKLPATEHVGSTNELWRAIGQLAPAALAFLLSFVIILITWVNHHGMLMLVDKSSAQFIYANGFLLLGVVLIPFPTSLVGEYLPSGFAGPAVALYNAVLAVLGVGWILMVNAAVSGRLARDAAAEKEMRDGRRNGYFAVFFYAALAVLALWFPLASASVNGASWLFWLMMGIRMKHE